MDLTAKLARNEPDPYARQVLDFALIEDNEASNCFTLALAGAAAVVFGGWARSRPGPAYRRPPGPGAKRPPYVPVMVTMLETVKLAT